jgi:hypothetical protein
MLKNVLILLSFGIFFASCGDQATADQSANTEEAPQEFGDGIKGEQAISYAQLVSQMEGQDSIPALVEAKVGEVCQAKGCWMTLVDEGAEDMRVTFKDYGFFMPKDLGGHTVLVEGFAYRDVTSVDDLRHFAEDAGKSEEEIMAITEPKEEIAFEATGVRIVK